MLSHHLVYEVVSFNICKIFSILQVFRSLHEANEVIPDNTLHRCNRINSLVYVVVQ